MRVTAQGLAVTVADRVLYTDLNFVWTAPSLVAVIGPSGSGKSTLLSAVMGWTQPSAGTLMTEPDRADAWLVPQNAPLLDSRTVHDNLAVATLAAPVVGNVGASADGHEVSDVLNSFGLNQLSSIRAKHLSGGERQRVALARAALRRPALLLADEVTAGLDPLSVEKITGALRELVNAGALVVVATHDSRVWSAADDVLDLATVGR